jgi:hypothetical protein
MRIGKPAPVELAAAIGQVREQLAKAIKEGEGSAVAFRAGPVELEFEVEFTDTGSADVGVRVWVVSAGAKGEISRATTNRLKVTLTPVDWDGNDKLIGDVGKKDISTK